MSDAVFDEIPVDPEVIKQHIVVRREAIAIMLREVSILSENLRTKIGAPAFLGWMMSQADATNDILSAVDEAVQKAQAEGDPHAST